MTADILAFVVVMGALAAVGLILNGYRHERAVEKRIQRRQAEIARRRDRDMPEGV